MRLTFKQMEHNASRHGLILERQNHSCYGDRYPYSLCDNSTGMTAMLRNLLEVEDEIADIVLIRETKMKTLYHKPIGKTYYIIG